ADKLENDEPIPDDIMQLLRYGSSMGGARPKAVVEDKSGLWIAKFNTSKDRVNYAKVEAATAILAEKCGIEISQSKVLEVGGSSVFLTRRFDRKKTDSGYERTHFLSALTMLGKDETES